uniref:C-type lectin domain-containing protein n=1 Tax=Oreochromis niloticus TaxID=8128 RepID=A0A669C3N2_ORENI
MDYRTRHKAYLYCVFLLVSLIRIVRFVVMHDKLDVNLLGFFFLVHQQYHFINKSLTWYEAQSFCRLKQKHTDLACVHTEQENLATGAFSNSVWIGLFKDSWYWSDGTKTSFRYWKRGGSYSGNCVSVEGTQQGRWIPADCNQKATFICQGGKFLKYKSNK